MNNSTGLSDFMLCPSLSCAQVAETLMGVPLREPTSRPFSLGVSSEGKLGWYWWNSNICCLTDTVPSQSTSAMWLWIHVSLSLEVWLTKLLSIALCNVGSCMVCARGGMVRRGQGLEWPLWASLSVKSVEGKPQVYISCIRRGVKLGVLRGVWPLP